MLTAKAPLEVLHSLQRLRTPVDGAGLVLYSVRLGQLVQAPSARGPGNWICRVLNCPCGQQCTVALTDDDLATALDPDVLTDVGHPDPVSHLIAYRAAWRSQAWQRIGVRAGAVADRLAGEAGPDTTVDLDRDRGRIWALQVHMLPTGFEQTVARLADAALLHRINDDRGERRRVVLTLPSIRVPVPA